MSVSLFIMDFSKKYDQADFSISLNKVVVCEAVKESGYNIDPNHLIMLSGGNQQVTFSFLGHKNKKMLLRLNFRLESQFLVEVALQKKLSKTFPVAQVTYHECNNPLIKGHFVITDFIEGERLSHVEDQLSDIELNEVGKHLGEVLAKLHSKTYNQAGFFNSQLEISDPFANYKKDVLNYMSKCVVNVRRKERLSEDLMTETDIMIKNNSNLIEGLSSEACLVHGEFDQKNILVQKSEGHWGVVGLLSWQYSFAGSSLLDLARFLRFEDETPQVLTQSLVKTYTELMGGLSSQWREQSLFLDLISALTMLSQEKKLPKTFATAKKIVKNTVERLNAVED